MKLYRVTLRGMLDSYGISYAIANNPEEAYQLARKFLDTEDLGFAKERNLDNVKLIADESQYGEIVTIIHLPTSKDSTHNE